MPRFAGAAGENARGAAVCVAARRAAAEAGAAALRRGGNAFDAAAAAGFVEAVIAPSSCGIGGYAASGVGFLAGSKRLVSLDADAVAPAAARADMFPVIPARDPNDYRLPDTRHRLGPLSVAVPGVLGGLLTLVEAWGRLGRRAVMAPAIEAARAGVELTPGQALTWLSMKAESEGKAKPDRKALPRIVAMDDLAATLEAIAEGGSEVFYAGEVGRAIVDDLKRRGGLLTREEMAAYRPRVGEPVTVSVRGHTLATPPPGSGGLTSLQVVALFDRLERGGLAGEPGSARAYGAFLEILKAAWEDRLTTLGDAASMAVRPETLVGDAHLDRLMAAVRSGLDDPRPGRIVAPDPLRGTVHVAAADAEGNVVAWTQTHGGGFGSGVMARGTGVVLGHGMCRFEPRPGWANSIAAYKRPLHNMCPLVAVKDGRAVLAVGATGGRSIVNNVAALAIGRIIRGESAAGAIAAPRLQCETIEPATIERSAGAETIEGLREMGHRVKEAAKDAGTAQIIARGGDAWSAAAEPRSPTSAAIVA